MAKKTNKSSLNPLEYLITNHELLANSCYYFDPPLDENEMIFLRGLLNEFKIVNSEIVTNPIKYDVGENTLTWFMTTKSSNRISYYQNPVPEIGTTPKDYKKWLDKHGFSHMTMIDGRELLSIMLDTDDVFSQLKESVSLNEIGGKRAKDTDVIYRDSNMVVVVPLSLESAVSFSRGTQYCTGGDCARTSKKTTSDMFKHHTEKGDMLYRILFKDGTKVRLTWNGKMDNKDFNWGLGKKDSYPQFSSRNMDNPFDVEKIKKVRMEQLELEFEVEPLQKKFDEWKKEFFKKWGWDVHNIVDVMEKIRKKWGHPTWKDDYTEPMNPVNREKMQAEEEKVYNIYQQKEKEILGKYYNKTQWWNSDLEELYKVIIQIPQEAISKMMEYAKSGKYQPNKISESVGDELNWAREIALKLPLEFVVSFCDPKFLDKHGNTTTKALELFNQLREIIIDRAADSKSLDINELDFGWFRTALDRSGFVIYFSTREGQVDSDGWDTCKINSAHHYEYVFPVEMFVEMYGEKTTKKKKLKEQDEFDWVREMNPMKGVNNSTLRSIMPHGYSLKKLTVEDLVPGIIIKRYNGKYVYELGTPTSINIDGFPTPGFKLKNVTTDKYHFSKASQILREFYEIIPNPPKNV